MRLPILLATLTLGASPAAAGCLVALDVGHHTELPGEISARGVPELAFNQALAQRVATALETAGIPRLVVNADGTVRDLAERPRRAGQAGATLLISLHHDSVQDSYKSNWVWEGGERAYSDAFSGYGLFVSAANPAFAESRTVAAGIADGLLAAGLHPSLHHAEAIAGENRLLLDPQRGIYRFDELAVLRLAAMPAVLVEAGIIVNRDDEPQIASEPYRTAIAAAIVSAAGAHCGRLD